MTTPLERARARWPGREIITAWERNGNTITTQSTHDGLRDGSISSHVEIEGPFVPAGWAERLSADVERETRDFGPMFQREIRRVSYPWTSDDAGIEEAVERKLAAINSWWKNPVPAPAPEPNPFAPFRAAYERARRASLKKELRARMRARESWRDFDAAWGFERPRPLRRLVRIEYALRSPGGMVRLAIVEDLERDLLGRLTRDNAAWRRLRQQVPPGIMDGGKSIVVPLNWTP